MINKHKILNAISEGIKTGFKFSSNSTIDDSSSIDFSDSKINNVKSLSSEQLNRDFRHFIDKEEWSNVLEYVEMFGTKTVLREHMHVAGHEELKTLISLLVQKFGPNINLNWIDVSNITDMNRLFECTGFNGDISEWDVSNVKNMSYIFHYSDFNKDISNWDVSKVTNMLGMFADTNFNGDISNWDVSNVTNMSEMFYRTLFNGDISKWNVSNVVNMEKMFAFSKFNQNISLWNVKNVKDMSVMFAYDEYFNQDLSGWNILHNCKRESVFYMCPIYDAFKPAIFNKKKMKSF